MTAEGILDRRRLLTIAAAAGGLGVSGLLYPVVGRIEAQTWQGSALGARATIRLYHPDAAAARRLIRQSVDEIRRLEQVFSLYRPDSAVSVLNRAGVLRAPPPDLVRLLAAARSYSEITEGAFDVTVQPLWALYASHFGKAGADPAGPPAGELARARRLVGFDAVSVENDGIAFGRPGMAVTLNGIAQGYITDRVADLLRGEGFESVLLDLGEIRAMGRHGDGRPWRVGVANPDHKGRLERTLELTDQALATSAGAGTRFDREGRHHHLFDPRSGRSASRYRSVSVIAPTATAADALSTGFTNLGPDRIQRVLGRLDKVVALLSPARDGDLRLIG